MNDFYERDKHYAAMHDKEYAEMNARLIELELEKKELEKKMKQIRSSYTTSIRFPC